MSVPTLARQVSCGRSFTMEQNMGQGDGEHEEAEKGEQLPAQYGSHGVHDSGQELQSPVGPSECKEWYHCLFTSFFLLCTTSCGLP